MELSINEISVEICKRLNIPIGKKTTGQVVVKCLNPYHIDNHPSCSISLDKGVFNCFSCGHKGSLKNIYYEKFKRSIYKDLGVQRSYDLYQREEEKADLSLLPEVDFKFTGKWFPMDTTDLSKNWMKKRGFNIELMNSLGIKYLQYGRTVKKSDEKNKEEWRHYSEMALIPIYENDGNKNILLCFEARQLRTEEEYFKYLESKNIDISTKEYKKLLYPKNSSTKTLYKLSELDTEKPLYVVEGLMDLISLRTHPNFQNSTTTFGLSIKERQFYLLSKFKKIIFIPNNDVRGISALEQLKDKNLNVYVLWLPDSVKDVNDILQKKDYRFNNLEDLVNKFNWGSKITPFDEVDLKTKIDSLS